MIMDYYKFFGVQLKFKNETHDTQKQNSEKQIDYCFKSYE